jgi:hypothetical protein
VGDHDRDYLEGFDALQGDMARHQRLVGAEVASRANEKLARETVELIEKRDADAKPVKVEPEPAPLPALSDSREIDGRKYTIEREPDKAPMYRTATEFEAHVLAHAKPRIELLMSKRESGPLGSPSWMLRTQAAMYFKVKAIEALKSGKADEANIYERAFQQDLHELLEASNQAFGDWRKDAPAKLIVTVTR